MRELIADSLTDFVSKYAAGGCRKPPPLTLRFTTITNFDYLSAATEEHPLRIRHWQRLSSHHIHLLCAYVKLRLTEQGICAVGSHPVSRVVAREVKMGALLSLPLLALPSMGTLVSVGASCCGAATCSAMCSACGKFQSR